MTKKCVSSSCAVFIPSARGRWSSENGKATDRAQLAHIYATVVAKWSRCPQATWKRPKSHQKPIDVLDLFIKYGGWVMHDLLNRLKKVIIFAIFGSKWADNPNIFCNFAPILQNDLWKHLVKYCNFCTIIPSLHARRFVSPKLLQKNVAYGNKNKLFLHIYIFFSTFAALFIVTSTIKCINQVL